MRILHFHSALDSGGIESFIRSISNQMIKRHDVKIGLIFAPKKDDFNLSLLDRKITVFTANKIRKGFSLIVLWDIFKIIQKSDTQIVHIHGFFFYYLFSILFLQHRIKFFYTIHSDAEKENVSWDKYLIGLKKLFFKFKIVHPITISNQSTNSFRRLYGCSSFCINNGIDQNFHMFKNNKLGKYRYTSKTKVFIHAGRITEAKNQLLLCKCFTDLISLDNDIVLLIVGENQDDVIFNNLKSFFSDRIVYLGVRSDVVSLMAEADAMCLSSIWEGLPITLLEAFSVCCIPICTPVGGIVDVIIDGENGILSYGDSLDDYKHAILRFLDLSDSDLNRIRKSMATCSEKYNIENTAKQYENIYSQIAFRS